MSIPKQLAISFLLFTSCIFGAGIDQASTYNKNSDLQWEWALSAVNKYPWKGSERVLDVGCGDGKITAKIAEKVTQGTVVGLDVSPKMIGFAVANFKSDSYKNLLFMTGSAASLPFVEQFDLITSFCALHWVLDQKTALKTFHDSLTSQGHILLVIPAASPNNLSTQVEQLVLKEKWAPHFPDFKPQRVYFTKNEYEKLLNDTGFKILSMEVSPSVTMYQDKKALIEWLKPLVTFIHHLSQNQQEEFLDDLAKEMMVVDPPLADGSIPFRHQKLEVLAVKKC